MEETEHKRETSGFVAYRAEGDGYVFFLQKRDEHAPVHANVFSLFGGGIDEGETPKQALRREVQEELVYEPRHAVFFDRYETNRAVFHVFIEEIGSDFAEQVTVQEGEYGRFLSAQQVGDMSDVSPIAKLIIEELSEWLQARHGAVE